MYPRPVNTTNDEPIKKLRKRLEGLLASVEAYRPNWSRGSVLGIGLCLIVREQRSSGGGKLCTAIRYGEDWSIMIASQEVFLYSAEELTTFDVC
jgi:hypothetical protein